MTAVFGPKVEAALSEPTLLFVNPEFYAAVPVVRGRSRYELYS